MPAKEAFLRVECWPYAEYGNDTSFRMALTAMEVQYVMGVQSTVLPASAKSPCPHHREKGNPGRRAQTLA